MKIGITGTHGTGKSTIVNNVYGLSFLETNSNVVKIDEVYRDICTSINKTDGIKPQESELLTLTTYYKQMELEYIAEMNNKSLICDRTPLDCFVYGNVFSPNFKYAMHMTVARAHCDSYDKIYLIEPSDRPITVDGFRNTSKKDQMTIHKLFLKEFAHKKNVIIVNQEKQDSIIEEIINLL